jgi:hypothetical protein
VVKFEGFWKRGRSRVSGCGDLTNRMVELESGICGGDIPMQGELEELKEGEAK